MWDMIERMASDRLWIYTAIFGSLFGAAFLFWFKDTKLATWGVAKFDRTLEYLVNRWYLFKQWWKGTFRGLLKGRIDGFSDHSMPNYYNYCKREQDK